MRKSKVLEIDGTDITLKELRVLDIFEIFSGEDNAGLSMKERLCDLLARCSDLTWEQVLQMTPTDLKEVWDGFVEVNRAFLDLAAMAGLDDLPGLIRSSLREQFAESLRQDTDQ